MYFRQLLNDETACASYLLGCKSKGTFAVVDPHANLVDEYIARAEAQGAEIAAVVETHVQADHVSGLPALVERTGATAYLPEGSGVEFEHHALADGERVVLGNTELEAIATPGHAGAHHAYLVTDRARVDDPWFVLTGDCVARRRRRPPRPSRARRRDRRGHGADPVPLDHRAPADLA
jgi:glyoxylase-like metal-dependent hydrolase (beta-lactamase superfamily II)